jgi:hypothetical protein
MQTGNLCTGASKSIGKSPPLSAKERSLHWRSFTGSEPERVGLPETCLIRYLCTPLIRMVRKFRRCGVVTTRFDLLAFAQDSSFIKRFDIALHRYELPVAEAIFLHQIIALACEFQAGVFKPDRRSAGTDRFIAIRAGQALTPSSGAGNAGSRPRRHKGNSICRKCGIISSRPFYIIKSATTGR